MSLKKSLALASVTALALGALATGASAGALDYNYGQNDTTSIVAGADFKVVDAGTDAMGADRYHNRHREWVTFEKVTPGTADITNWVTVDAWAKGDTSSSACNTFKFKTSNVSAGLITDDDVVIGQNERVRVYTGNGTPSDASGDEPFKVYMNSSWKCGANGHYITNNGDDLYLLDASGDVKAHSRFDRFDGYETKF